MDWVLRRLAERWCVKWQFLKDIYFLMVNDVRFLSTRNGGGIRYVTMSNHLKKNYGVELNERQLRYMVKQVRVAIRNRK